MKNLFQIPRRVFYVAVAFLSTAMMTLPIMMSAPASAATVTSRNIQMSTSLASATASYTVGFNFVSSASTQGIVVDFCDDSPIIGSSTCTTPGGFSLAGATISGQSSNANCNLSTFSSVSVINSNRTFTVTAGSPVSFTGPSCAASFTINGVTNPNTANHSFYARIYSYDTTAHTTGYTLAGYATGNIDYGGVALSTASAINITANVMETLQFCVSGLAPGPNCGTTGQAVTAPNVTLGHGSPLHLDSTAVDTGTAFTQISTNAQSGVVVKMANTAGCTNGGLKSGANCIPGIGTFAAMTAGTADFGLNVADGTGGTGTVNHSVAPQYGTTGGSYAMTSGVTTAPGDQVEQSTGAVNGVNSTFTFAATAATTTPAGVYTGNYQLTATGTF